jgi:hypothetical protein
MNRTCLFAVTALLAGCGGGASAPPLTPSSSLAAQSGHVSPHTVGLGAVLSSKIGGQIYGFGIDQNGSDGILATASDVETFDSVSGKIRKSFPKKVSSRISYSADGIFSGDVGLITRYVMPKGSIFANRFYDVVNPVTANKFTGKWTPPVKDIQVEEAGPNQTAGTTAIFAIELKNQDVPILFGSDIPKNTFGKVFQLNPSSFSLGDQPQVVQDTATNQAVIATSPDGGRVGGEAPINVLVNLKTGKQTQFQGLNEGPVGSGFVNGLAVDSTTGVASTTTELNAQVEFYNLAAQTGTAVQLPCTGASSQLNSGSWVTNDPVNGLFLVADPEYACGSGSAIVVYNESGGLVETITGFNFDVDQIDSGIPVVIPSRRMGWAPGPNANELQQFFY